MGVKGDLVGNMQETIVWEYCEKLYAQTRILENDTRKIRWDFEIQMDHSIQNRKANLVGWLVGFYGISTFVGYLRPNQF